MHTITVITPLHAASVPYLVEAYDSLVQQELPEGWGWEWAVQCDGPQDVPAQIRQDSRCSVDTNRPSGPGPTRTMALARTAGEIVRNLDADDYLTEGALARDIAAHMAHPEIGWTTAPAFDRHPDGSLHRWVNDDPEPGVVGLGWVLSQWEARSWQYLPIIPTSLSIRRSLVEWLGGWMALPTSEDTGLLLAANAVTPGLLHGDPGVIYRKHDAQVTATSDHRNPAHAEQRRRLIVARAQALRGSSSVAELLAVSGDSRPTAID